MSKALLQSARRLGWRPSAEGRLATSFACLALAILAGCGGSNEKPAEPPPPPAPAAEAPSEATVDGGGSAASNTTATSDVDAGAPVAPSPPKSTKAVTKTDPSWQACHKDVKTKGKDLAKEVAALGKACAVSSKMKPIGKLLTGSQSDSGGPQTFPLQVEAHHCYRVFAQGADSIKDLDIGVRDSTGTVVGEDSTDASSAIALEDGAICFSESDAATIVVAVGLGSGKYALQVWSD